MIEIKDCLPHDDAKKHFIDLRNIRLESERKKLNERVGELRLQLAAQGIRRSGPSELRAWQFKEEMFDALAMGYILAWMRLVYSPQPLALSQKLQALYQVPPPLVWGCWLPA